MATLLFTFGFFLLMVAAMAVGVLAGRGPILGSCGGMSALLDSDCPVCGGDPDKCDGSESTTPESVADLGYDAARKGAP